MLIDITVEVADTQNPEERISRAFGRLLHWIDASSGRIQRAAKRGRRNPATRAEREVAAILAKTEEV